MLIFLRPEYDGPTRYTARWAKSLVLLANKKGFSTTDLSSKRANRKTIESFLKKRDISFVMFNGHGGFDKVYGQDNEVLISANDNEHLLKSAIIYSLTCNSAKILGPASVKAGALAYIGYKDNFWFTYKKEKITRPLKDKRAQPFFVAAHDIVIALFKNHTIDYAVQKSKEKFNDFSKKMMTSEASQDDILDASLLRWNMLNLSYNGKGTIKL